MQPSAYAICFFGDLIKLYAVRYKPECVSELLLENRNESHGAEPPDMGEVSSCLLDSGYRQQPVLVGLDCFQALMLPMPETKSSRFGKTSNLELLLEEFCPVDAENMIAVDTENGKALVAIRDRIEPSIKQLQDSGINVRFVSPTTLLLAQTLIQSNLVSDDCEVVVGNEHKEHATIANRKLEDWSFTPAIDRRLKAGDDCLPQIVIEDSAVQSDGDSESQSEAQGFDSLLAKSTNLALNSRFESEPANFPTLCKEIKKTPVSRAGQLVGIAMAFLLFSIAAANLWSVFRHNKAVASIDEQVQVQHREAFPNGLQTRMVERALKTKCEMLSKQVELLKQTESTDRIVNSIYTILNGIPDDCSIRLGTILINNSKLVFSGTSDDLDQLDELKKQIEAVGFRSIQSGQEYGKTFRFSYLLPERFEIVDDRTQSNRKVDIETGI